MKFDAVKVELVNKQEREMNLNELLGNMLWGSASTIAQNRLAQRIYDGEDVELNDNDKQWILSVIPGKLNYAACAGLKKMLDVE